jgi:hypothetical protein
MKLYIYKFRAGYLITDDDHLSVSHQELAEYLGLKVRAIRILAERNNGDIRYSSFDGTRITNSYFSTKDECQGFLDELTPYLIMKKLIS